MDQVYQQLAVSQDGDSILNDLYGHDISITEAGDITAQDIVCANITVSGTISGNIDAVINQNNILAETISITGSEVNTTNGVLYKKADNKLYNSNGIRVNAENNTTEYQNNTHRFTNISSEPQLFIGMNGDVGLGVEQPVSKLHLSDVGGCSIRLDSVAPITGGSRIIFAEETLTKYQIANTENNDFLIAEGSDYIFYHDVSLSKTNLSGLLYIDGANSAVGVGSASPGAKFDVLANTTTPAVKITQTGVGDAFQVYDEANDQTPFIIKNNGYIGIGLANPLFKLDITGDAGVNIILNNSAGQEATGIYFRQQGGNKNYIYSNTGGDLFVGNQTNGNILVHSEFGNKTVINDAIYVDGANGNVGISETNPGAKLDVLANTTTPALRVIQTGSGDCIQIHDQATDTTYLCVNANGRVGVGNGAPTRDLDVRTTVDDGIANNIIVARTKTGAKLFEVSKDSINSCFVDFYDGSQSVAARIRGNGSSYINGGPLALGTQVVDASAKLQINSTNSGLLPPRMTTAQRNAISSPATGLIVFDTDIDSLYIKQTNNWSQLNSGAGQGGQGGSSDFMILRKTVNDTSQSTIAWDTHTKFSPNGLFNYTSGNVSFSVNQTGTYKIEFVGSFYDGNVYGEKEVYFIFEDSTGLISNSIGFIARADSSTTYSNLSFLDVVSLSTGVSYNFSFTSNTGQTASMYANGRCLITYLS